MKTTNYVVLLVLFNSIDVIYSGIFNVNTDGHEIYEDILIELLTECHTDYQNIIYYDDRHLNDYQISNPQLSPTFLRMNSSVKYSKAQIDMFKKTTRIDAVIMTIYRPGYVRNLMENLKSFHLLDAATPFYVFSRRNNSCYNRKQILEIAWETKLLTTLFICIPYATTTPLIYTFNPYAAHAPPQWSLITPFNDPKKHFRFYNRLYKKGHLCRGLDWDRTRYFNKSIVMKFGLELEDATQRIHKSLEWRIFCDEYIVREFYHTSIILDLLKASMNLGYEGIFVQFRTIKDVGYDYLLKQATKLEVDMILFNDDVVGYENFTMSYPFKITEYKIVTASRPLKNFMEHTYYVLGLPMLIMMAIILVLTFFVTWLVNEKKSVAFAFFEIIRLLIDASVETKINTASLKIFFMTVFFYFIIAQTLFQGELARFFTNPPRHKNPETLEDLITLNYKQIVYTRDIKPYMQQFRTPFNKHRYLSMAQKCYEYILWEDMNACVLENRFADFLAAYHLKTSSVIHRSYKFYITRNDSPIKNRLNNAFLRLWESGFSNLMTKKENNVYERHLSVVHAKNVFNWGKIRNRNLRIMYTFLGIGLSLAGLSFIGELILYYKIQKNIGKNKSIFLMIINAIRIKLNAITIRRPFNNDREKQSYRV